MTEMNWSVGDACGSIRLAPRVGAAGIIALIDIVGVCTASYVETAN